MKSFKKILALTISLLMIAMPVFAAVPTITGSNRYESIYGWDYYQPQRPNDGIEVQLNGEILDFTDEYGNKVEPQLINDRTMVPMRKIFEVLGAKVEWFGETESIKATTDELEIGLQINNTLATVKNESGEIKEITLDVAPVVINGRTLVPVRFIAESLDKTVGWDDWNETVIIIDTSFIEDTLSKKAPNFYEYFTTEFEAVKTFDTNIEFDGQMAVEDYGEKMSLGLTGDMGVKLSEKAMELSLNVKFNGSKEMVEALKEEIGTTTVKADMIFDFENYAMYIKSPLIKGYESKWIKYEMSEDEKAEMKVALEALNNPQGDAMEILKETLVNEDDLTTNSYDALTQTIDVVAEIMSDEYFKISGSKNKKYTYTLNMENVLALMNKFGAELSAADIKEIKELYDLNLKVQINTENNVATNSIVNFDFEGEEYGSKVELGFNIEGDVEKYNEKISIKIPTSSVVNAKDVEIEQEEDPYVEAAKFSNFANNVAEVQWFLDMETTVLKGNEAKNGTARTNAQAYNYVAKGATISDVTGDSWLTRADAQDLDCTQLKESVMEDVIDYALPQMKVSTLKSSSVKCSYFVTNEGEVFVWPPYIYENQLWVNGDTKLKSENGPYTPDSKEVYSDGFTFEVGNTTIKVSDAKKLPTTETTVTQTIRNDGEATIYYTDGTNVSPVGIESEALYKYEY